MITIITKIIFAIAILVITCVTFVVAAFCFLMPFCLIISCLSYGIEGSIKVENVKRMLKIKSDENARIFSLSLGVVLGIISFFIFLGTANLGWAIIEMVAAIVLLTFAIKYKAATIEA